MWPALNDPALRGYGFLRRKISRTGVYIPVGEFFMFLPVIPIMARALAQPQRGRAATLECGALFALAIAAGYGLAYWLLEVL